jgi:hypothetical protein
VHVAGDRSLRAVAAVPDHSEYRASDGAVDASRVEVAWVMPKSLRGECDRVGPGRKSGLTDVSRNWRSEPGLTLIRRGWR